MMLKCLGPATKNTVVVLMRRQLAVTLGNLVVIWLKACPYRSFVRARIPAPRMRAIRLWCCDVCRKVLCMTCLMLQVAPRSLLAVILTGALCCRALFELMHGFLAFLWYMMKLTRLGFPLVSGEVIFGQS